MTQIIRVAQVGPGGGRFPWQLELDPGNQQWMVKDGDRRLSVGLFALDVRCVTFGWLRTTDEQNLRAVVMSGRYECSRVRSASAPNELVSNPPCMVLFLADKVSHERVLLTAIWRGPGLPILVARRSLSGADMIVGELADLPQLPALALTERLPDGYDCEDVQVLARQSFGVPV